MLLNTFIFFLFFVSSAGASSPNFMTFQTRILSPGGAALEAASVNFRFTILDTAGTCTLYVEDYTNINMTGTQGIVSFPLGSGTKAYPPTATNLYEVFDNSVASFPCQTAGTVSPAATDNRQVVMQFNDGSGWQTLPQMAINSVPYANYATRSENLGAYPAANYLRPASLPTCSAGQSLRWDGATFTCIAAGGGSTYTGVTSIANASGDITLAPATTTGKVSISSGTASTSTTTGALVVTGGVGVSGAVNVQTDITAGTSVYTPQIYGSSSASGNILVDGTSHATKGNVLLATAGGKVGIGTAAPAGVFEVQGGTAAASTNGTNIWLRAQSGGTGNTNGGDVILTPGGASGTGVSGILSLAGKTQVSYGVQGSASTFKGLTVIPLIISGDQTAPITGVYSLPTTSNANVTDLIGYETQPFQASAIKSATNIYDYYARVPTVLGSATNSYGFYAEDLTAATNNWAVYTAGTTKSYFGGNVGIGTNTPAYALDVSGDVNISGNFRVNGTIFSGGGGGSSTPTLTGITSISNASGDITLAPVTASGAVLITSGAASLGTNTGALVVTGGIGASGAVNAGGNISSGGIISAATSMYSPQLYGSATASGNILIDGTSHGTKGNVLLATAGGNVGIGTTSPAAKLHLFDGSLLLSGTNGATPASGAGTRMMWIPAKNAIRAGSVSGTKWDDSNIGQNSIAFGIDSQASGHASAIGGGTSNTTSATHTYVGGGTANSATYEYAAVGGGYSNSAINFNAVVCGGNSNTASGFSSAVTGGEANIAAGDYSWSGGRNMQISAAGHRTFAWGYSATPVSITQPDSFIVYSGNVGIGTTSPSKLLEIYSSTGESTLKLTSTTNNSRIILDSFPGNSTLRWDMIAASGTFQFMDVWNGTYPVSFEQGSGSNAFFIKAGGNIGVGTSTPAEKLSVVGNIVSTGQIAGGSQTISSGTTAINWNNGNTILTDYDCASDFQFANLRDGGTYTLVVTGTGTAQCGFSTTTTGMGAGTMTYRFKPANAVRTASSYSVYTLMRVGTVVLVSWTTGF